VSGRKEPKKRVAAPAFATQTRRREVGSFFGGGEPCHCFGEKKRRFAGAKKSRNIRKELPGKKKVWKPAGLVAWKRAWDFHAHPVNEKGTYLNGRGEKTR